MEDLKDLIKEKWTTILETIKTEFELQDISYKTWILPLKVHSVENNTVYLLSLFPLKFILLRITLFTFFHRKLNRESNTSTKNTFFI